MGNKAIILALIGLSILMAGVIVYYENENSQLKDKQINDDTYNIGKEHGIREGKKQIINRINDGILTIGFIDCIEVDRSELNETEAIELKKACSKQDLIVNEVRFGDVCSLNACMNLYGGSG